MAGDVMRGLSNNAGITIMVCTFFVTLCAFFIAASRNGAVTSPAYVAAQLEALEVQRAHASEVMQYTGPCEESYTAGYDTDVTCHPLASAELRNGAFSAYVACVCPSFTLAVP